MKLVVALGNPGTQYTRTRHNTGWIILDAYAKNKQLTFTPQSKFKADITEYGSGEQKVLLVKPTTFYNETGQSARLVCDFYKIPSEDVLIVHDELALPFGSIRTRVGGRDAGNNGIKSVNAQLGESTARIRVGISSEERERIGDTDFVLSRFNAAEQETLDSTIIPKACEYIDAFIADSHEITSHTVSTIN